MNVHTADNMTEVKTSTLIDSGKYEVTGYVLTNESGDICIVDKAAVRWISKDEAWNLMHPSE